MASEDFNLERGIVQGSCSWVHDASSSGLSACLQDCNLYEQNFPPPPPGYIETCRGIDAVRRIDPFAAVAFSTRPSTPPGHLRPSSKSRRQSKGNTTWHPSTGHWTWTSTALRRSGAPLRCASFVRSKNDKDHDARRVERRTADATKRVLRRQRRKMDKIEMLVHDLEIDWRMRKASDAVDASSDCKQDTSEVRDEFLEAFGPLEPVPILPFLKDLTKETC